MTIYEKAAARIRDRRREAIDTAYLVRQQAMSDEALYNAFCAYQEQMILAAQNMPNTLNAARAAYSAAMTKAGLTADVIDPPYACELCKDTGKVGGRYCKCVIAEAIASDPDSLALPAVDFAKAGSTAPGAAIKKAYDAAQKYIDDFPAGKPFLVVKGEPGTGKTMLAAAITTELMKRGASAVAVTAFGFLRRALDYHTQFSISDYTDGFTPMLDCELLVIDDLGTESMLKNVTKEYLYTVINERWLHNKYTVITTNRSAAELNARYGESIFSRMCDKSRAVLLSIDAKNARIS